MKKLKETFERLILDSFYFMVILPVITIGSYYLESDKSWLYTGILSTISYVIAVIATTYITKKKFLLCIGTVALIFGIAITFVSSALWVSFLGRSLSGFAFFFLVYCFYITITKKKTEHE